MRKTIDIFFCYAREDEWLLDQLKNHLIALQRQELIDTWHDRNISAGTEWKREINKYLNKADIILLLVSPSFMASDYCYSVEVKQAMERHERGEARVIPVILRRVYWQKASFGKLQALPTDAQPILSTQRYPAKEAREHYLDDAFFEVAEGIRKASEELMQARIHRFNTAYQADDDDAILDAYEQIQFTPNAQSFVFTESEYQRIAKARLMAVRLEQLWYTWSFSGLSNSRGFQIRAASSGLMDIRSQRVRDLERYCSYKLPTRTTNDSFNPSTAPVCLALVNTGQERVLVHKTYLDRDGAGRPGNFFVHLLAGLPEKFSVADAIRLWRSPLWQTSDQALDKNSIQLPTVPLKTLHEMLTQPLHEMLTQHFNYRANIIRMYLPLVIEAYLTKKASQRIYIVAPAEDVALLIFGLTYCLPPSLLKNLTFSTYEANVSSAPAEIVGFQSSEARPDLPDDFYREHFTINCYLSKHSSWESRKLSQVFSNAATQGIIENNKNIEQIIDTFEIDNNNKIDRTLNAFLSLFKLSEEAKK